MIKILIVEDDPMVASINQGYVQHIHGYEVVQMVNNIEDAKIALETKEIDLILLDVYLPNGSGLELFKYIRRKGIEVDIIFITAVSEVDTIAYTLRHGVSDFLIKPFTFERFKKSLEAYREKYQLFHSQKSLSQLDLDDRLFPHEKKEVVELPKGLSQNTLTLIMNEIKELAGAPFTTEEITQRVGITRVSIRKYLRFLTELQVIEENLFYGGMGRPISQFIYNGETENLLEPYLG